jgi:hypothetical protein
MFMIRLRSVRPAIAEASPGRAKATARLANLVLGLFGLLLLALALRMGPQWGERHSLPVWTWSWSVQMRILLVLRLIVAVAGLMVLVLLRPWFVHACAAGRGRAALASAIRAVLAVLAALIATELVLRTQTWRAAQEQWNLVDPLRIRDPELGWSFAANRAAAVTLDGRVVHYATGPFGYRAPGAGIGPDFRLPTVIFAGESIVFGYGLEWPETIAARVQAIAGVQTANIAVNAQATDQIYMRLRRELPRFAHPVAVVIPFMPRLLDRNLDVDKPHLDARLRWRPAEPPPIRMVELSRRMLRYRSPADIASCEATTSQVLKAAIAEIARRGARPIVLVPQYLPEAEVEKRIRRDVLDRAAIRYLLVPIPADQRNPSHGHPTPAGAATLAKAVSAALAGIGG